MDMHNRLQNEIELLTAAIGESPGDYKLYLERGKLYHRNGAFDKALNDFVRVRQIIPTHTEAGEYIAMIREIFEFHYKDIYNP